MTTFALPQPALPLIQETAYVTHCNQVTSDTARSLHLVHSYYLTVLPATLSRGEALQMPAMAATAPLIVGLMDLLHRLLPAIWHVCSP